MYMAQCFGKKKIEQMDGLTEGKPDNGDSSSTAFVKKIMSIVRSLKPMSITWC